MFHKQLTSWINGLLFVDNVKDGTFPNYTLTSFDVLAVFEGKKVEWWRVHEEGLPNWYSCCPLLWTDFISLVPHFLSRGHGEI